MILIKVLPFVCLFYNLTNPTGFYENKAEVQYKNSYNSYVYNEMGYSLTQFDVTLNCDLYFDDNTSYRLDFKDVDISWYIKDIDSGSFTYDINLDYGFNYDTINTFVPRFTFLIDEEDDLLICNIINNNVLLYHYEYELDITINETSSINAQYDMTSFYSSLDEYLSMNSQLTDDYNNGYQVGFSNGEALGFQEGRGVGYTEGFADGVEVDDTAIIVFNGILNIALVPINFFLAIFNFEILGINISQLVTALLSVCLVLIVVRFVTGKKQGGE